MDAAESTDESAEDITAADTAPSPEIYLPSLTDSLVLQKCKYLTKI